jgi:hypothetical protein
MAEVGASHLRKLCPHKNAEITGSNGKEDKGTAMVRAARLSKHHPFKAKPETQNNMLIRGARAGSCKTRTINSLHHTQTRRTGRTRTTIPWDCQIATLQRQKQYYIKKSAKKSTKGSKCTFQNTKSKCPRQGQSEPRYIIKIFVQSDKDKKHIQPYKGAISMNNNFRTSPIVTYARPETFPR